jgi:AcrR family transcriptional regulator
MRRVHCPDMPSVTRKAQNSRAARRDELRDQLLEVVERLIDEGESFTEISVERIVAEADISRTTFYVYFADKGDMLSAWFADIAAEVAAGSSGWWEMGAQSTREDLRGAIESAVNAYRPHIALMAASFHAAAYDATVHELTDAFMESNVASLCEHVIAGQKAGFVDPSLPAADVAVWLLWMAERGFHAIMRDVDDAELQRQIDAYTAIVWNTLYAPTHRP